MISPTGRGVRGPDAEGDGRYGAPRGNGRLHAGVDYVCQPGQAVLAPISGKLIREARPYATGTYSGVLLQGDRMAVKIFYFEPHKSLIGQWVDQGQEIGRAQDISLKYGAGMTPHVHVQCDSVDVAIFTEV